MYDVGLIVRKYKTPASFGPMLVTEPAPEEQTAKALFYSFDGGLSYPIGLGLMCNRRVVAERELRTSLGGSFDIIRVD